MRTSSTLTACTIARCVYLVGSAGGGDAQSAWVLEFFPPADFVDVRPHVEQPVQEVEGVGDGAYQYRDPDTGRWRLYTHRRGVVAVSATGLDPARVRKLAALALARH